MAIYLFYLFAGCPYEFVKCYLERKNDKENENENKSNFDSIEIYEDNINENGNASRNMRNSSANQNNINNNNPNELKEENKNKNSRLMIGILIFLGVLCQPLYLAFYAIYTLIECYKRLNCLFFLPR